MNTNSIKFCTYIRVFGKWNGYYVCFFFFKKKFSLSYFHPRQFQTLLLSIDSNICEQCKFKAQSIELKRLYHSASISLFYFRWFHHIKCMFAIEWFAEYCIDTLFLSFTAGKQWGNFWWKSSVFFHRLFSLRKQDDTLVNIEKVGHQKIRCHRWQWIKHNEYVCLFVCLSCGCHWNSEFCAEWIWIYASHIMRILTCTGWMKRDGKVPMEKETSQRKTPKFCCAKKNTNRYMKNKTSVLNSNIFFCYCYRRSPTSASCTRINFSFFCV